MCVGGGASACVGLRRHAYACVGLRMLASAYIGMRRLTYACVGLASACVGLAFQQEPQALVFVFDTDLAIHGITRLAAAHSRAIEDCQPVWRAWQRDSKRHSLGDIRRIPP